MPMLIDFEYGLSQLSGNESLLIKLYGKLHAEYAGCHAKLSAYLNNSDMESARTLAHTLKGVSGNLGCNALYQSAQVLEQKIKDKALDSSSLEAFENSLNATMSELDNIIRAGTLTPTTSNISAQLIDALKNNEFVPPDFLNQCLEELSLSDDQRQVLEQSINRLDYQKALEILGT